MLTYSLLLLKALEDLSQRSCFCTWKVKAEYWKRRLERWGAHMLWEGCAFALIAKQSCFVFILCQSLAVSFYFKLLC